MTPISRSPLAFWIVVALGLVVLPIYLIAIRALHHTGGTELTLGWSAVRTGDGTNEIRAVDGDGPAQGQLQAGDRIVAINGQIPMPGWGWLAFMDLASGDTYSVRVQRGPALADAWPTALRPFSAQRLWLIQVPLLMISLCFCVTAVAVGVIRPNDRVARLYTALGLLVAMSLLPFGVFSGESPGGRSRAVLSVLRSCSPFMLSVAYHFFTEFPPGGSQRSSPWRWITVVLYVWSAVLLPAALIAAYGISRDATSAMRFIAEHRRFFELYEASSSLLIPLALVAIVAVLVRNHVAIKDVAQRRRLRWVLLGSIVSAAPFATFFVVSTVVQLASSRPVSYAAWLRAQAIAQLFLVFLPVTFAYAVVQHRVIGVEVAVRRSLQYLLAKNVLRVAVLLPIVVLVARIALNPNQTIAQIVVDQPSYLVLGATGLLAMWGRDRIGRWLDRRFFRDIRDREQILLDLSDGIKYHDAPGDLARVVAEQVDRALHPTRVRLQLLDALDASSGSVPSAVVHYLEHAAGVIDVPFGRHQLPADIEPWFLAEGTRLAVPIGGTGQHLHGVLLLGEKKSEEEFSREDRRLLQAVAGQIAMVCDNALLRQQTAVDARIKQDVLARVDTSLNLLKECPSCGRCYNREQHRCDSDGAELVFAVPVDRTIDGKYRLDQLLGRGGMGSVYGAWDLRLGREVAVKLLKGSAVANDEARRRFEREARASARLRHPNIIAVYDCGTTGSQVPFLVMERLYGTTLREEIRRTGGVDPAVAAVWFAPIFDAIGFAHRAGVVHRDLKPENVFVSTEPSGRTIMKVLDFGVAKLTEVDLTVSGSVTNEGDVVGTLAYMAPEQLAGKVVDGRADVFALGVMVLEALIGFNPFRKEDPANTVAALLHGHAGVHGEAAEVRAVDGVLQQCLAKLPEQRFAGVEAMTSALLPALAACGPLQRTPSPVDGHAATRSAP